MFFHRKAERGHGFAPGGGEKQAQYKLDPARVGLGLGLIVLLGAAAFVSYSVGWEDGATMFLHTTEIAIGGMVGFIFGEKSGMSRDGGE